MAEFLPPSMPEPPPPDRAPAPPDRAPAAKAPAKAPARRGGPGALGKLISLIVSVGLAWALTVAITAWLLSLFLSRG